MTTAWPAGGPAFVDDLVARSTAPLDLAADLPMALLSAPSPHGSFEIIDGRGLFVRTTQEDPTGTTDAWYVHGLAGSSTNWTPLAEGLASLARGHVVDLPGHGRSDPPPHGRYSMADNADLVAAAIRRRSQGPVHLVGNSLGGVVSVFLAARHPELVRTLTLISPAVPDLRLGQDRGADSRLALLLVPGTGGMAARRLGRLSPYERARGMAQLCFGDPSSIADDDILLLAEDLGWRFGLPWLHTGTIESLRALMGSYLLTGRRSFAAAAHSITVPTLVVWGTHDRLVDARLAPPTTALFPNGRLLLLRGVGHTAQMEDPLTTARAMLPLWRSTGAPHQGITETVATSST